MVSDEELMRKYLPNGNKTIKFTYKILIEKNIIHLVKLTVIYF